MDISNYAIPAAIVAAVLLFPRPVPSSPVINVEIPDIPPAQVEVVVEPHEITLPEQEAPVVNVTVPAQEPTVVNVQPAPIPDPEVIIEEREVVVTRDVIRGCIDTDDLPHFDLPGALTIARPGEEWSLSGDYMNGLVWHSDTPQPTFNEILAAWIADVQSRC